MDKQLIVTILGILVAAVPFLIKMWKVYRESKDWKKIGMIGLDFIEHQFAHKDEKAVHVQKKQLQSMQDLHGVSDKVDKELTRLREERLKLAKSKDNSFEAGVDFEPETGKWMAGAKWKKVF